MTCHPALDLCKITDLQIYGRVDISGAAALEKTLNNPGGYVAESRENVQWLEARGVCVQSGWDLFTAAVTWTQRFPQLAPPGVVFVHGLH